MEWQSRRAAASAAKDARKLVNGAGRGRQQSRARTVGRIAVPWNSGQIPASVCAVNDLRQLEAENAELRQRAVELALDIQLLRGRWQ